MTLFDANRLVDYTNTRIPGGPQGVAYDTVEGLKKNHGRLEKEDIHLHLCQLPDPASVGSGKG